MILEYVSYIMKIILLVYLFPPKWMAGTEIATYYLAEHMAQRGHEVHVITSLDKGLPKESYEKGFHIHRLKKIRFGLFFLWVDIIRAIRKINPDIIHAQGFFTAVPAIVTKKALNIPFVVWGQGADIYRPDLFIKIIYKSIYKNADSVIALTEHMKQEMLKSFKREIHIIPNGIKLSRFSSNFSSSISKEDTKNILFVGRLHPVKGLPFLIKAIKEVREKIPDIKLFLVGNGEDKKMLSDLTKDLGINDCVVFMGTIPHDKISAIMNQSDIFVLPSLSESFGLVLLEAMACGLPIVATNVGGGAIYY